MILPLIRSQRLEPLRDKLPGQLVIHEIYKSIQGESTFAGLPCVFVRLTACMARCSWCDIRRHSLDDDRLPDASVTVSIGPRVPMGELNQRAFRRILILGRSSLGSPR